MRTRECYVPPATTDVSQINTCEGTRIVVKDDVEEDRFEDFIWQQARRVAELVASGLQIASGTFTDVQDVVDCRYNPRAISGRERERVETKVLLDEGQMLCSPRCHQNVRSGRIKVWLDEAHTRGYPRFSP